MNNNKLEDLPQEVISAASIIAQQGIVFALLKHVSQGHPEVLQAIRSEALNLVAAAAANGESPEIFGLARKLVGNGIDGMIQQMTPVSQIADGFQKEVRR